MEDRIAPGARPPTMEDVAARAGVSRALVSIVFRNQPGASEETRRRVRDVASVLGYAPDQHARLLGRKRSGQLGVAFGLQHGFHGELVEAMYSPAEHGYELVLTGLHRRAARDEPSTICLPTDVKPSSWWARRCAPRTWSRSVNSSRPLCWRDGFPAAR